MGIFMRFPNGKAKAVTLSYDDGFHDDIKLVQILDKYGLKATFNLNSGCMSDGDSFAGGRIPANKIASLYKKGGHEVAIHGLTHSFFDKLPENLLVNEIAMDKQNLEEIYGGVVRGVAYPYGAYNDRVVEILKTLGIAYSRTCISTEKFAVPTDWLRLPTTCHHKNPRLNELCDIFLSIIISSLSFKCDIFLNSNPNNEGHNKSPLLFYLWGHSFEFSMDNNWEIIENFCKKMSFRDDIWFATNIEIYDYTRAYNSLEFSIDGNMVYNPSAFDVWFLKDGKEFTVKSGETTNLL